VMHKKSLIILITLATTSAIIFLLAVTYKISKLPEEVFVKKFSIEQISFDEFNTFADAITELANWENARLSTKITWVSEHGTATLSLKDLGVTSSLLEVQNQMDSFMQEASELQKIKTYLFGQSLGYQFFVDEKAVETALMPFAIEQGNDNAKFIFQDKEVAIQPEQIGYGIDTDALKKEIEKIWLSTAVPEGQNATLELRTSSPEILQNELSPLLETATKIAKEKILLTDSYGNDWDVPMANYISWIVPPSGEKPEDNFDISEQNFITYAELNLVPNIEKDPSPATITDDGDGTYSFSGSARFGIEIDKETLRAYVKTALKTFVNADVSAEPTVLEPIQIPLTQIDPQITVPDSLKTLGVTDLLEFGYSDFSGSPANRIHNIQIGIAQFNGVIVDKDATFSFMSQMSPVDAEHDFLPELVIKGDETIPEFGGGLCQISSTMFRAIIYTGLPIVARTNHSYAVSYYARPFGYGLDATVYDPAPDLKFLNNTPASILIQSYTDGNSAFFVFYGTNDGRRVEMEGPYSYDYNSIAEPTIEYTDELAPGERQLDTPAHTGFTTDWFRTIFYADGTTSERENIHSVYEARPAKYLEGKATISPF